MSPPNSRPSSPTHLPTNDVSLNFIHTDASGNIDFSGNYIVHIDGSSNAVLIDSSADFIVTTSTNDVSFNFIHTDASGNINFSGNYIVDIDGSSNTVLIDSSADFIVTTSTNYCFDISGVDSSGNDCDCSMNSMSFIPIVDFSLNQVTVDSSMQYIVQQGTTADDSFATFVSLTTIDPSLNPQIEENLQQVVTIYNDEVGKNSDILNEIRLYASQIQCDDFHGKGTIDDYTELFKAAAKIANESKHIELDVDIGGFEEFGQAADELSDLFNGFIMKLQNVNIIDDYNFLKAIASALKKIVNLSNIFGTFKETILATSTVQIPKSAHDAKIVISGVMDEVRCAMQYINYFVDSSANKPVGADLTNSEKTVIDKAITTIDSWNILCEQGISIALSNDVDIKYIKSSSDELKTTTNTLKNATANLKAKLSQFHYC